MKGRNMCVGFVDRFNQKAKAWKKYHMDVKNGDKRINKLLKQI